MVLNENNLLAAGIYPAANTFFISADKIVVRILLHVI